MSDSARFLMSRRQVLGAAGAAALAPAMARAEVSSLTIGSTNATSSSYAIAVAMAKAVKAGMPNVNVSLIETGASVDNVRRMTKKEIDFGLVMVDTSIQARAGTGPFSGKAVPDLSVLYVYDIANLYLAVRADAGVNTLADLQGKKFSAGIRGSGAELLTREVFKVLGIEPVWSPGSVNDATEGIANRQLVGYSKYGAGPTVDATLRELMTTTPMKLLGLTDAQRDLIKANTKGVDFAYLPDNIIPGQTKVLVPSVPATYSARTGTMDDATAYGVVKSLYEHRQFLTDVWPHMAKFDYKGQSLHTEDLGLVLHPGAKKYWSSLA
jgi:TRAP transporter TAXI family solute receptor